MPVLEDRVFLAAIEPLTSVVEASGFKRVDGPQPTWLRELEADGQPAFEEKVVLWQHPRQGHLHGYVATTRHEQMVHLRLYDTTWRPGRILPGYLDKGWPISSVDELRAISADVALRIWPRALLWLDAPVDAEELLMAAGRVPSVVRPGPMLERHRERAAWLEREGRTDEAAFVRGVVAEIETLFAHARRAADE